MSQTDALLSSILSISSKSNGRNIFSLDTASIKCDCDVQSITDRLQSLKSVGVQYTADNKSPGLLVRVLKQPSDIDSLMKQVRLLQLPPHFQIFNGLCNEQQKSVIQLNAIWNVLTDALIRETEPEGQTNVLHVCPIFS